jgi:ketosteroid isomerase-like protein
MRLALISSSLLVLLSACASTPAPIRQDATEASLKSTEIAFAESFAARDFNRFASFIADDAIFLNGGDLLRGKPAILAFWQTFFKDPAPPFSWTPSYVAMLADGSLGQTSGPVSNPAGKAILNFESTWRAKPDGSWEIIFDNGFTACGD